MDGLNRVQLLGNLCSDPELKLFQGGSVLKLRLACTDSYWDKSSGTRKEKTEYVNVSVFDKRGEALSKFLEKGHRVFVEGALRTSSWTGDGGVKRYRTEVNATNIILLTPRSKSDVPRSMQGSGVETPEPAEDFGAYQGEDDEIPFD
jgi:single-strand DNA-binding protein